MKVILVKDVKRLGLHGEVKEVADSYAINVLIPKGLVIQATPSELAKLKQKEESKKHKKEMATSVFAQLIDAVRKNPIVIANKKKDSKGQLFAHVKENDIGDAIFEVTKLSVDPRQIILKSPIKHVGTHIVLLKKGESQEQFEVVVK